MNTEPIVENGWALEAPDDADIGELMCWFPDAQSVDRWGGPGFRYPFTPRSFRDDCRIDDIPTYRLRNPGGAMCAFGQVYDRHGRGHLARLITHPEMRRRGIGKRLVGMLTTVAGQQFGYKECSLFVYKNNLAAYRCYVAMGFVIQEYPNDAPMKDKCHFLTRENNL